MNYYNNQQCKKWKIQNFSFISFCIHDILPGERRLGQKDSFMNSNVGSQCEILCLRIFKLFMRQLETSCLCLMKPQIKMWPHFMILLCSVLGEIVLMPFSHFMSFRFNFPTPFASGNYFARLTEMLCSLLECFSNLQSTYTPVCSMPCASSLECPRLICQGLFLFPNLLSCVLLGFQTFSWNWKCSQQSLPKLPCNY